MNTPIIYEVFMTSAVSQPGQATAVLSPLDEAFIDVLNGLLTNAKELATRSTEQVFQLSQAFVEKEAAGVLREFHRLYFGDAALKTRKEEINHEVDDLFDQIQAQIAAGRDGQDLGIMEDEKRRAERLGLAGLQKQLEGIITLDKGIRAKVLPALTTMQFEDVVRQRLTHVVEAWTVFTVHVQDGVTDFQTTGDILANITTSQNETKLFYDRVLRRPAPPGVEAPSVFLSFLEEE